MKNTFLRTTCAIAAMCASVTLFLLTGCGGSSPSNGGGGSNPVVPQITGHADGGQGAIAGATVQIYAVGDMGLKSASTPLLTQTVVTGNDGNFTLTGLWSCTDTAAYGADPLLYITVTGGTNASLGMMTAIGPCSTFTAPSTVYVNEVTTVAAVYALAPFMSDRTHVGASSTLMTGLKNAFSTASALANSATGATPGAGIVAGETVPVSEINSLADVITPCVNTAGGCAALFAAAAPAGGTAATNAIDALLQIVTAPAHNVAAIYALGNATTPFTPRLPASPADWSLMLRFTGNGISGPTGIALDANGNAWIANVSGSSITGLSAQGASLTGTAGYTANGSIFGAQAIAVDRSGSVWVADTLLSKVFKLTMSNGAVQTSSSYSSGVSGPTGVAVDANNNIWLANFGDGSVTVLDNSGTPISGSPLTANGALQSPSGIAIDGNGRAWVTDSSASVLTKFDSNGTLLSGAGFSDGAVLAPQGVAIDSSGHVWVAGNGSNSVDVFTNTGTSATSSPITGGGILKPTALAIDGAGTAWVVNSSTTGGLTSIAGTSFTPVVTLGSLNIPAGVAVDASGNVWTANVGDDSISKFVGLATPIATPLAH